MQVTVRNHISWESFLVTDIGKQNLILGLSYLRHHNPEINWKTEQIEFARCPSVCAQHTVSVLSEEVRDLDLPHLEELALDHYTELNDDEWSDQDQFMYWVNNVTWKNIILYFSAIFYLFFLIFYNFPADNLRKRTVV